MNLLILGANSDVAYAVCKKFAHLEKADLYIIAINDDSISSFSKKLQSLDGLVVHTSGSIGMKELDENLRRGVFYPRDRGGIAGREFAGGCVRRPE